jgi:hypothetical protein
MSTGWRQPDIAISCSTTSSCLGTMPPDGCYIARLEATAPIFDGSPYAPPHLTGGLICAPAQDRWALGEALFKPPPTRR